MTPLEIILEQQRRLLASIESIESIESVVRAGRLTECRGLIADFESDLGSAIDAPILPHLQSRLALLHARVGSLEAAASEASAAPAGIVGGTYDPLVEYRGRLGKAVLASDLNNSAVSVPDTTHIWWRCSRDPRHQPWLATKAQTARGRPCPRCMADAGLSRDAWFPTDTRRSEPWLDAFNHAMLWSGFG
jgi:hypothetical protein